MGQLDTRIAIVTGASQGIGEAVARRFVAEGARVALAARRPEPLQALADELRGEGGEVIAVPTDVRDRGALQQLVDTTLRELGDLDLVVNNAGVGFWENAGVTGGALDEWRAQIDVNLTGLMELTKLAADTMDGRGGGDIVNVSSGAGRGPGPDYPAYSASKHGVNGFTHSAFFDLRKRGIRVTLIEPGEVDTPMQDGEPDEFRAKMLRPDDIADAIVWAITRPRHMAVADMLIAPSLYEDPVAD